MPDFYSEPQVYNFVSRSCDYRFLGNGIEYSIFSNQKDYAYIPNEGNYSFRTKPEHESVIYKVLPLLNCDSIIGWAMNAGDLGSVSVDSTTQREGYGCIQLSIPKKIINTAIYTNPSGSWDLSGYDTIGAWCFSQSPISGHTLLIGETAYDEFNSTVTVPQDSDWHFVTWDISWITVTSRDAITKFGIRATNDLLIGGSLKFKIDDIIARREV